MRLSILSEEWTHFVDRSRALEMFIQPDQMLPVDELVNGILDLAHSGHAAIKAVASRLKEYCHDGRIENSDDLLDVAGEAHAAIQHIFEAPSPEYQQLALEKMTDDSSAESFGHRLAAEIVLQELAFHVLHASGQSQRKQLSPMDAFRVLSRVDAQKLWETFRHEPPSPESSAAAREKSGGSVGEDYYSIDPIQAVP